MIQIRRASKRSRGLHDPVLRPHHFQFVATAGLGLEQHLMHRRCSEFERRHQLVPQQQPRQEQPGSQVAYAHRLTRKRQQRPLQVPAPLRSHQQHLELVHAFAGIGQVLHQHRLRPAHQQLPGHADAVLQRLRAAPGKAVQLQLVRAQQIRRRHRLLQQELADLGRYDAALLRMPHHRVAQTVVAVKLAHLVGACVDGYPRKHPGVDGPGHGGGLAVAQPWIAGKGPRPGQAALRQARPRAARRRRSPEKDRFRARRQWPQAPGADLQLRIHRDRRAAPPGHRHPVRRPQRADRTGALPVRDQDAGAG
ncbi:hypothetical protein L1887_51792 [Cichorium endivia]|nr:hypothetical protein L1887_51792 [Cichorium endivia]